MAGRPKIRVAQFDNGELIRKYDDISTAAIEIGGQVSHISECMRNVPSRHTHKGYEWRGINEQSDFTMGKTEN